MEDRMACILLVYGNPAITAAPVPPYGMERVAQAFRMAGCTVHLDAPFIEEDPAAHLQQRIASLQPDLIGFSVRNIDDTLIVRGTEGSGDLDTSFYLDDVRRLTDVAVAAVGPERVMAGGAAVGAGPEAVLDFLGLTWGISGPAEDLCWRMGRSLAETGTLEIPSDPRVIRLGESASVRERGFAAAWRPPPGPTPRMGGFIALAKARGTRVPVQIAHGCDRRCVFCVEARTTGFQVFPRSPDEIFAEIHALYQAGVRRFWLTASELNVPDESHGIAVLQRLAGLPIDLRVYIQPAPVSHALLDALENAGIDPGGISFEFGHLADSILRAGGGPANLVHIERLIALWRERGYGSLGGSALFGAHWLETEETLAEAIANARRFDDMLPEGFGLAFAAGGRLYPETALADWVAANREAAAPHLYGDDDPTFVRPVVFCKPASPRALLQMLNEAFRGTKGAIGPMNTEAPAAPSRLLAEQHLNRGLWRLQQGQPAEAATCLEHALASEPRHPETLRQLALVRANHLGDRDGAVSALQALQQVLPPSDPGQAEIQAALRVLGA